MKHTTHKLSKEQKENLLSVHKDLIYMILCCGGFMLRRQIKGLYCLLTGEEEMSVEFDISELIFTGFLLQKTINKDTRTQMLYLSKYPKSHFLDVGCSRDVPAISWTTSKIFEQIFKMDYLIEKVVPDMREQNFIVNMDNIVAYLDWNGSNIFLSNNQYDMVNFYRNLWNAFREHGYTPTDDFLRDAEIAQYDMDAFEIRQLKKDKELPPCPAKVLRDKEKAIYNSDIERNKNYYNLKNFASHGFYVEDIQGKHINICYFDKMNNIQTKQLWTQLSYILLMFQRYLCHYDLELHATIYTWDKAKAEHLYNEENKIAFDFYRRELADENKKYKAMQDIGLPRQHWESIHCDYFGEELYSKYDVHL